MPKPSRRVFIAGGAHTVYLGKGHPDTALWPHDAPFAPAVYRRVGDVLFEMAHPDPRNATPAITSSPRLK